MRSWLDRTSRPTDAAHGAVALPTEAPDSTGALQLADTRMYGTKRGGRAQSLSDTYVEGDALDLIWPTAAQ